MTFVAILLTCIAAVGLAVVVDVTATWVADWWRRR